MWRIILAIFSVIILTACSVSIDPQVKEDGQQQSDSTAPENSEGALTESDEEQSKSKRVKEIISDVFHINWLDGKDQNAQDLYYLALGDSLTRGVGDETKDYGYTIRLQEQLEKWPMIKTVELDNRGKNGRRSDQLLHLLQKGHYDKELEKADFITMTLGGNDVMKIVKKHLFSMDKSMFDQELPKFIERYEQIIAEIRLRNAEAPIILIGFYNPFSIVVDEITPFEPIISEWNAAIEQLSVQDVNACFVPVEDLFVSNEDMVYHVDFFHPNSAGYERMTNRVIETLQACNIEEMSDGLIGFGE